MEYLVAAKISDLQPNTMLKVHLNGKDVLLVNCEGAFYALNNRCPHMGGSLANGKLEGHTVTCPRHGTQIDVRNGSVLSNARILFISMNVDDAEIFPIRIEGDNILVGF